MSTFIKKKRSKVWISVIACLCLIMPLCAMGAEKAITFNAKTTEGNPVEISYQVMKEGENGKNGTAQICRFGSDGYQAAIPTDTKGKIIIPETVSYNNRKYDVTCIGSFSFNSCQFLTEVVLPSSIAAINNYAFYDCRSLKNINISHIKIIEEAAFENCISLETITLPSDFPDIEQCLFRGCTNLKNITLPSGIASIRYEAFADTALTDIYIPANVDYVDSAAFRRCYNLLNIIVDQNNPNYTSVDGALYNKEITALEIFPKGRSGEYNGIPNTVTGIASNAFEQCTKLTGVNLPERLSSIGAAAFSGCASLNRIIIPDTVTKIEESAFRGCDSLTSINIPSSLSAMGTRPFGYLDSMLQINVDKDNPNFSSLDGILYNKEMTALLDFPKGREFTNNIPDTVTEISENAFAGCTKLRTFIVPNTIKTIGKYAFSYCYALTNIVIPASVTKMDGEVFLWSDNLKVITFKGHIPPVITGDAELFRMGNDLTVYIPKGSAEAYKKALRDKITRENISYIEADFSDEDDSDPYLRFFTDVPRGKWYTENVNLAASVNLVNGVGGGLYEPEREVTRAEFINLTRSFLDEPINYLPSPDSAFYSDAAYAGWYYEALWRAWQVGVLRDFSGELIYPEQAITREEMAAILAAVAECRQVTVPEKAVNLSEEFTDYEEINPACVKAVQAVYKLNLMRGAGDKTFSPKSSATRAEAAAVLVNLAKILGRI